MKPADYLDTCQFGDVRAVLRQMIADGVKVQTIVTSPPYWGLRSYLPADHPDKALELGSEPTLPEFLANMVEVFDLCHQILRHDGTLFLNMGDSYAGSRDPKAKQSAYITGKSTSKSAEAAAYTASRRRDNHPIPRSDMRMPGFKPKDMVGQPWRLAFALQDAGWYLRQDIVWHKPNPMPESAKDRCTKAHEFIFLLTKRPRYYFDSEAIREPVSPNTHARLAQHVEAQIGSMRANGGARSDRPMKALVPSGWATGTDRMHNETEGRYSQHRGVGFGHGTDAEARQRGRVRKLADRETGGKSNASFDAAMAVRVDSRNKRSVWTVPTESYKGAHFATYPQKLIEPCVLAGSPVGAIVFDPFFGSGTTGLVARRLGRHFIGIDLNRANAPLQADRIPPQPSLFLEAA
ncbi:Modification methylase DpnIIB [Variovorax sp. PBS-H4]|uniref:DNA-methyltransferase n=1 Tax=Variovorax sp. PBS-H4 TaxID=434008 RepID=UPI001317BCFC|nr:site-specific DNA-methyltransferase [Variovorax sp. PBS-H4]VTU38407.1 Modification methylase DpnIIB [Variovorax sp. PBS-H4]